MKKIEIDSLSNFYAENLITTQKEKEEFNFQNAWRIFQTVTMTGGAKILADQKKQMTEQKFFSIITSNKKMYIIKGDYSNEVRRPRIEILFADEHLTVNPCDFWKDIKTIGLDNEGFVDFKNGKKPLKMMQRILKLATYKDAIILDFF